MTASYSPSLPDAASPEGMRFCVPKGLARSGSLWSIIRAPLCEKILMGSPFYIFRAF